MISKEELQRMYWDENMSQSEIGKAIGVSNVSISNWMKEYGIYIRTYSEARSIGILKEDLERMYCDEQMTQEEIAKEIGVSTGTVSSRMQKYGIDTYYSPRTIGIIIPSKEKVERMYWEYEMSQSEIAKKIGMSKMSICNLMKKYNIESRTQFAGELSSGWKGGISGGKYCYKFNNKFKEAVRVRDDYTCQLCGYEQLLGGQKLDIHHIHFDKENCYPDVVALCRSCNAHVNGDRDYWEQYFEDQLIGRGLLNWSVN